MVVSGPTGDLLPLWVLCPHAEETLNNRNEFKQEMVKQTRNKFSLKKADKSTSATTQADRTNWWRLVDIVLGLDWMMKCRCAIRCLLRSKKRPKR